MNDLFLLIAHGLNVVVAGSLGLLLLFRHRSVEKNFGWDSPARQMFASVYLTIMLVSLFALVFRNLIDEASFILFPIQIVYAFLCLLTVESKRNPIIWINVVLALFFAYVFVTTFLPGIL